MAFKFKLWKAAAVLLRRISVSGVEKIMGLWAALRKRGNGHRCIANQDFLFEQSLQVDASLDFSQSIGICKSYWPLSITNVVYGLFTKLEALLAHCSKVAATSTTLRLLQSEYDDGCPFGRIFDKKQIKSPSSSKTNRPARFTTLSPSRSLWNYPVSQNSSLVLPKFSKLFLETLGDLHRWQSSWFGKSETPSRKIKNYIIMTIKKSARRQRCSRL